MASSSGTTSRTVPAYDKVFYPSYNSSHYNRVSDGIGINMGNQMKVPQFTLTERQIAEMLDGAMVVVRDKQNEPILALVIEESLKKSWRDTVAQNITRAAHEIIDRLRKASKSSEN